MKSKLKKIVLFFLVFLFCLNPFYRFSSAKKVKANAGALVLNGGLEIVNGLLSILGVSVAINLGSASGVKDYIGVQKCLKCDKEFLVDGSNALMDYYEHCNSCNGDKNNLPDDKKRIPVGQELLFGKYLNDSLTDEQKNKIAYSIANNIDLNIIFTANQLNDFAYKVNNLLNYDYVDTFFNISNPNISEKVNYLLQNSDNRLLNYRDNLKANNYPYVFFYARYCTGGSWSDNFYYFYIATSDDSSSYVRLNSDSHYITFYSPSKNLNSFSCIIDCVYTADDLPISYRARKEWYGYEKNQNLNINDFIDNSGSGTLVNEINWESWTNEPFHYVNSYVTDSGILDFNAPNGFTSDSVIPDLNIDEEYIIAPIGIELPVNYPNSLEITVPAEKVQEWSEFSYDPAKNNNVLPDSILDSNGNPNLDEITENVSVEEKTDNEENGDIDTENNSLDFSPLKKVFQDKFPFCMPWDIKRMLEVFSADEKPIKFEFDDVYLEKFNITIPGFTVDFSEIPGINIIVSITKFFSIIAFIAFLIIITRNIIKG